MELVNDEPFDECLLWDVSDLYARFRSRLPRRRWFTLNTEFLGPHFSAESLANVPRDDIERLLGPHNLTQRKQKSPGASDAASCWMHRPDVKQPFRGRLLLASTKHNYVAWAWIDPSAPPTFDAGDQLARLPQRLALVGWAGLSADEQAQITLSVNGGGFGDCAPMAGWPEDGPEDAVDTSGRLQRRRRGSQLQDERSRSLPSAKPVLMAPPPPSPRQPSRKSEPLKRPAGKPSSPQKRKKPTKAAMKSAGTSKKRDAQPASTPQKGKKATVSGSEPVAVLPCFSQAEMREQEEMFVAQIAEGREELEELAGLIDEQATLLTQQQAELDSLKSDGDGDAARRADRLGVEISNLKGTAAKMKVHRAYYDAVGRRRRQDRELVRTIVNAHIPEGVEDSEHDKVLATLGVELVLLKKALKERYEGMRDKNGGKGVESFVRFDGLLEPLDLVADLELKRRSAKHLMEILSVAITSSSWRRDQKTAEQAVASNTQYYQRRTKLFLSGAELEDFVSSRREANDRELCLLADIIVNMSMNGAQELHTQLLLYLSLSRQMHGQAQISMAHDSTFRLASSYGTTYHLSHHLSKRYLDSFPQRRLDMLERSPSRSRDPGLTLDDQGRRWDPVRDRWVRIARVLGMKFDNYVKLLKVRRHLRNAGNVRQIVTETMVVCEVRENWLEHPTDRRSPINPPYSDKVNEEFWYEHGDDVEYGFGGRRSFGRRWNYTSPTIFNRENVPTVPDTFRLHENVIGPQVEGCSSRRADYVLKLLSPNADLLADGVIWFHIMDTEYWLHMFACLEIKKMRRRLLRPPKKEKKEKKPKAAPGGLIPEKVCPKIDAALSNRVLQRNVRAFVEMAPGRVSMRLQAMRGVIERVFLPDERLIVLSEMREQDTLRLNIDLREWAEEAHSTVEADADDGRRRSSRRTTATVALDAYEVSHTGAATAVRPPKPTRTEDSELRVKYDELNKAPENSRWCEVTWDDESNPPSGFALLLLNPAEYSLKKRSGHWCVFEVSSYAEEPPPSATATATAAAAAATPPVAPEPEQAARVTTTTTAATATATAAAAAATPPVAPEQEQAAAATTTTTTTAAAAATARASALIDAMLASDARAPLPVAKTAAEEEAEEAETKKEVETWFAKRLREEATTRRARKPAKRVVLSSRNLDDAPVDEEDIATDKARTFLLEALGKKGHTGAGWLSKAVLDELVGLLLEPNYFPYARVSPYLGDLAPFAAVIREILAELEQKELDQNVRPRRRNARYQQQENIDAEVLKQVHWTLNHIYADTLVGVLQKWDEEAPNIHPEPDTEDEEEEGEEEEGEDEEDEEEEET